MNWLIFGAGAIGTYIGGSLALSRSKKSESERIVFIERPPIAAEIRARGLRLNLDGKDHLLPNPLVVDYLASAFEYGPFDVAVFALKSYDTQAALADFHPFINALPSFICLQNGIDNEPALGVVLGQGKVISGTVTSAVGRRGTGDIVLERRRGVGIAAGHPLSEPIVDAFNEAGLNAQIYSRAEDMKWSKMLTNLLTNATSAILDMTPAEILAHPGLYRIEIAQLREALQVMDARGIQVVDLPATPVRALAFGVRTLPEWLSRPLLMRAVGHGRGSKMPSFHIDLYGGRGLSEVEYLNGAVARHGDSLGIPTPVNDLLTATLLSLVQGKVPLGTYTRKPEKLLDLLPD